VAPEFVTEYDRVVHRPAVVGGPLVEITPANAHVGDLEQYVFLANVGLGNFADFDGAFLRGVVYNGGRLHEEMSRLKSKGN
jgi:hypothetical protein